MRFDIVAAEDAVAKLSGWHSARDGKAISKTFVFDDFPQALAFMTCVGVHAEKMDHHPEWSNVYNRIVVELTTHDAGTVTTLDVKLAQLMDKACGSAPHVNA